SPLRKTRTPAAFRRQNAGNCVLIVERFAVIGESCGAMVVKSGRTAARQDLTFASCGRTDATERRNTRCARIDARSDPIDVKFLETVENSDRIGVICGAT